MTARLVRSARLLFAVALVCAAALLAVAAPAPAASPSAGAEPLTFRVGWGEDTDGMNPFAAYSGPSWEAFRLNYNYLTWYDDDYKVKPELAESWSNSADGKTWTFKIRSGVTWQDGQPLTARDIAFTYNLILDNGLYAFTSYLPFVTRVTAPDDTTVVIENSKPAPGMLDIEVPILPEHIWGKVPKKELMTYKNVPVIGSGPFQVTEVKKGKYISLSANKQYWGGAPTIDRILFQLYTGAEAAAMDYKSGNVDILSLWGTSSYASLKNVQGSTAKTFPAIGIDFLGFNCWDSPKSSGNPALLDPAVRAAFNWAIDKEALVKVAMYGLTQPGNSVVSPLSPVNWTPDASQLMTFDPEKAKQLLEGAGYTDSNGDGVRESKNGEPLSFELVAMSQYPQDQTAAKLMVGYLKDVGIRVRLKIMDETAFVTEDLFSGDFDMYIEGYGGGIYPTQLFTSFTSGQIGANNFAFYANPDYDKLYEQWMTTIDPGARQQIADQMQQMLYEQSPYVVLWYTAMTDAYKTDKWEGWKFVPGGEGGPIRNWTYSTYVSVKPVGNQSADQSGGGSSATWIVVVVVVIVAAGAVALLLVKRRGRSVEES